MAKRERPKVRRPDRKTRRPDASVSRPGPAATAPQAVGSTSLPSPGALDAQAVALFQQAMEALQRKRYGVAADKFRLLVDRFPGERALLDRSRMYLELAQREQNRKVANPRTVEERVTAATAALNNDLDADAERLVRSVLADDGRHDLALYLMAVVEARRGDNDAALSYLGRAIGISPEVRAQARYDTDFDALRLSDEFQQLVDPPVSPTATRKTRRKGV